MATWNLVLCEKRTQERNLNVTVEADTLELATAEVERLYGDNHYDEELEDQVPDYSSYETSVGNTVAASYDPV